MPPSLTFHPGHDGSRKRITKLIKALVANETLMTYLCCSIVLALDLTRNIVARVDLNLEPTNSAAVFTMATCNPWDGQYTEKMKGMIQLNGINVAYFPTGLPKNKHKVWEHTRANLRGPGIKSIPLTLVEFIYQGDNEHAQIFPLPITSRTMAIIRSNQPN
ncbi:hypothetical protein M422DRAFT_53327 [Sphaerobolus stellatus SS14]|uniref:DUF8205 domain-containing protein n=1 Tax=Sphaerobolus stellatus (strain SS14) TaxID=990650 RepID=A0A0C9UR17_SPHS4|nr:hypothetical protein M422DRAFT_53327 [Sphaerobolus stellatus SS14]